MATSIPLFEFFRNMGNNNKSMDEIMNSGNAGDIEAMYGAQQQQDWYKRKAQEKATADYGLLAEQFLGQGQPGPRGPMQQYTDAAEGGLLGMTSQDIAQSRPNDITPPMSNREFALRASQIPGRESMANDYFNGQYRQELQLADNLYKSGNMTASEQATHQENKQKFEAAQKQQIFDNEAAQAKVIEERRIQDENDRVAREQLRIQQNQEGRSAAEWSGKFNKDGSPKVVAGASDSVNGVKLPSGYHNVNGVVQPMQGTEPYIKGTQGYNKAVNLSKQLDEFEKNVDAYGSEKFGAKAGEMAAQHFNIMSIAGELANLGVLQPGDAARLAAAFPDPSDLTQQFNPAYKATTLGGIKAMREEINRKIKIQQESVGKWEGVNKSSTNKGPN